MLFLCACIGPFSKRSVIQIYASVCRASRCTQILGTCVRVPTCIGPHSRLDASRGKKMHGSQIEDLCEGQEDARQHKPKVCESTWRFRFVRGLC